MSEFKHVLVKPEIHEALKKKSEKTGIKITFMVNKILKQELEKKEE